MSTSIATLRPEAEAAETPTPARRSDGVRRRRVLVFPGQGAQRPAMALALREDDRLFRSHLDSILSRLADQSGVDLMAMMTGWSAADLARSELAQLPLFGVEYALALTLRDHGVTPDLLLGHSLGELTAAAVAGVLDEADAVRVIAARARGMHEAPPGAMLVVGASQDEVAAYLGGDVTVATVNAERQVVLGGPPARVDEVARQLGERRIPTHRLPRRVASHTPLMSEAASGLAGVLHCCTLRPPRIPIVSAATGQPISDRQACDPHFWARQLVEPLRFLQAAERVLSEPCTIVEVGPGDTLVRLLRSLPSGRRAGHVTATTLPREPAAERAAFLDALTALTGIRPQPSSPPSPSTDFVPPQGRYQETLAAIWCEVLGVDRVGATDEFLAIGGHSLLATSVTALIRDRLHVEVPLRATFERPTLAALASYVEELSVRSSGTSGTASPAGHLDPFARIPRRGAGEPAPLSFAQRRLWFLAQYEPDNPAYHTYRTARIAGDLDVAVLAGAIQDVVARHEVLRTVYRVVDDEVSALVLDSNVVRMAHVDVTPDRVEQWLVEEARRPFDLSRDPSVRVSLVRQSATEHVLCVVMHHIAGDGWSMSVFFDEVGSAYAQRRRGEAVVLPDLPVQYADFAAWQRAAMAGDTLAGQLRWWRESLAGAPASVDLPSDRPRPAVSSGRGAEVEVPLGAGVTDAVRRLARDCGCTPFMVLLSGLQLLISRYTGAEDVVVGSPIAGRTRQEVAPLVGCFINTLPLRTDLTGDPTVRQLLARVRDVTLDAYAHQDLPFEVLVDELRPERSLARSPLFSVMLNVHNQRPLELRLPDLDVGWVHVASGTTKFDLTAQIIDDGGPMTARLTYSSELFDEATMRRLGGHLRTLLAGMAAGPEARIAKLPMLTGEEERQILRDWNQTGADHPPAATLHRMIEAQARRRPDAIAVSHEGRDLTYAELDHRANRLAHHLRGLGVGPDRPVGLFAERSAELIVGMLAILKAGGAYVPIDPVYPDDRIKFMLSAAGVTTVVTQRHLAGRLHISGEGGDPAVATLEDEYSWHPDTAPAVDVGPDNLVYVLFTSGSTGRPKGVAVAHRSYVNYLHGLRHRATPESGWSWALVSTFAADLGTTNVFGALCSGGRLHVVSYERSIDPDALADYFSRHRIDAMKLVPSHMESLLTASDPTAVVPYEMLILAGEACRWQTVDRVRGGRPGCRVQVHYGPTETTVSMLGYPVPEEPGETTSAAVPLGRPFDNTRTYVLDRLGRPVPVGVPGELHIAGPGVARGYLGRPDLTAERFLPDPFTEGGQMYRTGDLVRYRADGVIEFLGRIDSQVKIRGFRVELAEVEAALVRTSSVREAAVVVHGDQLAAYVVIEPGAGRVEMDDLRLRLRGMLPDYMVPATVQTLEALPRTANGKVDRPVLPEPARDRSRGDVRPPRDAREERIAAAFAQVLGIHSVGRDDDFFDLGGSSFSAVRVVRQLGDVPVIALFQRPVVADLAAWLEAREGRAERDGRLLHRLTPGGRTEPELSIVCVPYGGGNAIAFKPLADRLPRGHALYAVQLPGHDTSRAGGPLAPLAEVAQRCAAEIRRDVRGPIVLYGHCLGAAMAVEIARLLEADDILVRGVVLGAAFPGARRPARLFDLRTLGGAVDDAGEAVMIDALRHDRRQSREYYTRAFDGASPHRLTAPILCVLGERDRSTEMHEERYAEWGHFSDHVDLAVIPRAGHYFVKHQARILADAVTGWARAPHGWSANAPAPRRAAGLVSSLSRTG